MNIKNFKALLERYLVVNFHISSNLFVYYNYFKSFGSFSLLGLKQFVESLKLHVGAHFIKIIILFKNFYLCLMPGLLLDFNYIIMSFVDIAEKLHIYFQIFHKVLSCKHFYKDCSNCSDLNYSLHLREQPMFF